MAYTPATLSKVSTGTIDNSPAGNRWLYTHASDSDATVKASGYFSDAYKKGVRAGDVIDFVLIGTGLYTHVVLTCTSAPACTVTQTPATST